MKLPKSWNEPAYPVLPFTITLNNNLYPGTNSKKVERQIVEHPGITKGEYFTVMAMQGLLACSNTVCDPNTFGEYAIRYAIAQLTALESLESTDGGEGK